MGPLDILYIGADQLRFDCLAVNGHPLIQTPNLDRLALRGVSFVNAFTPCPVCSPARASLMTGQWAHRHACITIPQWTEAHRGMAPTGETLPQVLHAAGYEQYYVGKWHLDDHSGHPMPEDLGIDHFIPEGHYYPWRTGQGFPLGLHGQDWWTFAGDPEKFDILIRGGTDSHIKPEQSKLHWGADRTIEFIRSAAATDKPFMIRWDPSEPHPTNIVPEPYASMYDPLDIQAWGSMPENFLGKPFIQQQQLRNWGVDRWIWEDWAPLVARYLGEISLLDYEVGRVLSALEDSGRAGSTVVVFTADHGDLCGSHGMMDKHFVMYDDIVKVPLIIAMPTKSAAGQGRKESCFVSHAIDLASTLCDAAGVGIPESYMGKSLVPAMRGTGTTGREFIVSAYHGGQFGLFSQRMIRDHRFKYVWNPTDVDELYDLGEDPWELDNRIDHPQEQIELARLRKCLVEWMRETADPLLNPWTMAQLVHGRKGKVRADGFPR